MDWYKTLNVNQKINAKDCFELLCGVSFESLSFMFSYKERLDILYDKFKMENFDIE